MSKKKQTPIVRWLGAFGGRRKEVEESISFELTRPASDVVCCEPIWNGRSRLSTRQSRIGLMLDMTKSEFVKAYAYDAYTYSKEGNWIMGQHRKETRCKSSKCVTTSYEDLGKLGRFREEKAPGNTYMPEQGINQYHGEVLIRNAHYKAVVLRKGTKGNEIRQEARELAEKFGLPLVTVDGQVIFS